MARWRYKLEKDYEEELPEWWQDRIKKEYENEFFRLGFKTLLIKAEYAWDGCSGPGIGDGKCRVAGPDMPSVVFRPGDCFRTTTRGSLKHDLGYQFMEKFIEFGITRKMWDDMFRDTIKEDGFLKWKRYHWGVRKLGGI